MTFKLDKNFEEKVYAGVLGKIIGVFLGRPFEGWSYERIMKELGPINYYVNGGRSDIKIRELALQALLTASLTS